MKNRAATIVRDWEPRALPGGFYCSPACAGAKGFCTRAAYDRAVNKSNTLARRLGDGWEPEVWENLGWFWRVSKGAFDVREDHGEYSVTFNGPSVGHFVVQISASAETPEDAIGFATQDARTLIRRIEDALTSSQ